MEKIIINDHIQGDPLSEESLDKTLEYINKIRLLSPNKTIWLYTGYEWEILQSIIHTPFAYDPSIERMKKNHDKRQQIISMCDVLVDGRYIDSQRNVSAKWKGSDNQRVIDVKKSLEEGRIILWD